MVAADVRVAFQGEPGAFSDEAVAAAFGAAAAAVPKPDFPGVARAVLDGEAEFGMLPVENSVAGSVIVAYDVLADPRVTGGAEPLTVVGEIVRPIRLCLLGLPGASADGLRRVLSHPVALAQCQRFLATLASADAIAVHDTAGAARVVAEAGDTAAGAVAGRAAAARYGLDVLAEDIQDRPDNQTRFFILARPGTVPPWAFPEARVRPGGQQGEAHAAAARRRTALLMETEHRAGALVHALQPFADAGVSLTRIESRPTGEPWHYRFFLELDGDPADAAMKRALAAVGERTASLRVLGSFVRLEPAE